jgi:anti-anti-sigma factor
LILNELGASFEGVQTQISGDVFILRCEGRIVFGDECAILPGSPEIVVDLEGMDHIDSEGLGMLVGLLISSRNRAGELKLACPGTLVKDLLRRTNLDTIFRVYEKNDEAVAAFGKQQLA